MSVHFSSSLHISDSDRVKLEPTELDPHEIRREMLAQTSLFVNKKVLF